MKRKKTEETPKPEKPAKFWPVPGVDGEPYPPLVQEALDLVEKETRRRKIRECKHEGRYPSQRYLYQYGGYEHECGCRSCGAKGGEIACLRDNECNPEVQEARKRMGLRTPAYGFPFEQGPPRQTGTAWLKTEEQERRERRTDRHVSRQIQRVSAWDREVRRVHELLEESRRITEGELARSAEGFILRNANGEMVLHVTDNEDRGPDLEWIRTMDGRKRL